MNTTKRSLLTSLVACFVLLSMLMGTTFAWFTDIVSSENNVIQSGSLKAEMYWSDKLLDANSDEWIDASAGAIFNHEYWEPGYTQVRYVKVVNNGSLKFKWQLSLAANGKVTELSDVIDVYYVNPVSATLTSLDGLASVGTLTDVLAGNTAEAGSLDPQGYQILAIAFHMDEYAGNDYQDMSLCEAGFSLKLLATQATGEFDSFDDQYDVDAEWPYVAIQYSESEDISDKIDTTSGTPTLTEDITIGETTDDQYAEIPSDVKLADGADKLTLKIESIETPNESVPVENGESKKSVDLHIDGLAEDNTVPVTVTLKKFFKPGLNTTSVKLYHVENGTPVAMTLVSNPTNHNEFSYDPATGDVVMTVSSFSEYVTVEDDWNKWEGTAVTNWYNDTATEFTLTTAEQLAGFGVLVDGGNTFEGKTIKLGADIDLGGTISFNPIGYSYSYKGGQVFKGTFDGQNHTISNLYVNGWDIGLSYSMAGGGFFASVEDATIKNVTFSNANIVMECIEQGVVAGLAAGNCTFDNINIYGCKVANYQRATGGVVGEVNPYRNNDGSIIKEVVTHTFKNINIDSTTVIGSMWGDFDAPVGGVIGAKWDDDVNVDGQGVTQVVMENVKVACRLDVYNDVTSTYQWYAYRRAGMLIGNTEEVAADGRTAKADFLTCKKDDNGNNTVFVYYGENWRNYHYCEFNNANTSWPFVRVEAGEHCTAFSNPRWGVPNGANNNNKKVTPENHTKVGDEGIHQAGDDCMVLLQFNQLYGGGQGVYGQPEHDGVNVKNYAYSIQYVNDNKLLAETLVESNASDFVLTSDPNYNIAKEAAEKWVTNQGYTVEFGGWVNAGSTKVTIIDAGNKENVVLYPYFNRPYTARFVDQNGNVLAWCLFHSTKTGDLESTRLLAEDKLPSIDGFDFNGWKVHIVTNTDDKTEDYNKDKFAGYETDVTIYPVYKYNGDVSLIPVDSDGDGDTDYYQVGGFGSGGQVEVVDIPNEVNGIPVIHINNGAFKSFDDLYAVEIPENITYIGWNAFTEQSGTKRDQVTLYYAGDPDDWKRAMDTLYVNKPYSYYTDYNAAGTYTEDAKLTLDGSWDSGAGDGSRIFFLDENGKVDQSAGYWELFDAGLKKNGDGWFDYGTIFVWIYHDHPYDNTSDEYNNCGNKKTHYKSFTDYDAADRPDKEYWTPAVATTKEN